MNPRAARTAPWIASDPLLAKRTRWAHGTMRQTCSASSTSAVLHVPNIVPRSSCAWTVAVSAGSAWPSTLLP